MTTGDPCFCVHCGDPTGLTPNQTCRKCIGIKMPPTPVFREIAPGYEVTEPRFVGRAVHNAKKGEYVDVEAPPTTCPSCGIIGAKWKFADDHPESCYACENCNEHYSRNRESIYVPVGMPRETAEALLGKSPFRGFLQKENEDVEKPPCPICGARACSHLSNNKQFECRSPACGNRHDDVDDILCRECRDTDECGQAGMQFVEVDNHDEACLLITLDYKKGHMFLSREFWEAIKEHAWPSLIKDLPHSEQLELELVRKINSKEYQGDIKLAEENIRLIKENDNLKVEKELYYTRAKAAESSGGELQQKVTDLQGGQWDDERTIQGLRDDLKKALEQSNEGLELLWSFVDAISEKPRKGNVFERGREALAKVEEWRHRSNWLIQLSNKMYRKPDAPGEVILEQVDELMKEAATSGQRAKWFDQIWKAQGFPNTIEEYGKNFGRASVGLLQEYMHNAEKRGALIQRVSDYFALNIQDDDEKIIDYALVQYENYKDNLRAAKDNHRLDGLDIINAIEEELPGITEERFNWMMAKLRDISNGKGRGGIQS